MNLQLKNKFSLVLVTYACFYLNGCDKISGISSDAELTNPVNIQCIDGTLKTIKEVGDVEFSKNKSTTYLFLPNEGETVTYSYVWFYWKDKKASLQIFQEVNTKSNTQHWAFTNGMTKMGEPYPNSEINKFASVLYNVNNKIEENCGLPLELKSKLSIN